MSLKIRHINADSTFLLVFSPPCAVDDPDGEFPGSFTILVDPWLSGPSKIWKERFAVSHHVVPSCVESLSQLPTPDVVIISQDKSDHCHEATMRQLNPDLDTVIMGPASACKTIKSWKHFNPSRVQTLRRYDTKDGESLVRIPIPPFSSTGLPGEVTISMIASKIDMTGLHNAIGITYRAPTSVFSSSAGLYVDLPTPPASPPASIHTLSRISTTPASSIEYPSSTTLYPSPYGTREKCVSVIYSPHGCGYDIIKPYASNHLLKEAALPLTALLHSWNVTSNPWYLGGTIIGGFPDGASIALHLFAKVWISAHDEEKDSRGLSVQQLKIQKYEQEKVKESLDALANMNGSSKKGSPTSIVQLDVGQTHIITAK